ncbi:hypothetical protein CH35J_006238 [Colletotrichum higginsianum]|uniref:histone acetyltransferase n=1 Tax=Colletotrichum higginsianum TaxID=80884 RepID=A0A4T0W2L8_9PEZI|nr:hypothetical protein CH35J_006238 [Colletotrichum higginsianum]
MIRDFFDFDEREYAVRISTYETDQLRKQEIVKTRQIYAASGSIGAGVGGAAFTAGATLVVTGYGARRYYVANKKLQLIQQEVTNRGYSLHEFQKRDFLIPVTASMISVGLGAGLGSIAAASTNTSLMVDGGFVPSDMSVVEALVTNPGDTIGGALDGAAQQSYEMVQAGLGVAAGTLPGTDECAQVLAQNTVWVPADSASQAVGFQAGMVLAQAAEKAFVGLASNAIATFVMEGIWSIQMSREFASCPRHLGVTKLTCRMCNENISDSWYWHCCECNFDNYDLCTGCYKKGARCPGESHTLKPVQKAENPDFVPGISNDLYASTKVPLGTYDVKESMSRPMFQCGCCSAIVYQGMRYHCCLCDEDDFDMCHGCYKAGGRCHNPEAHALQLQLAGDWTALDSRYSTFSRTQKYMLTKLAKLCAACDVCEEVVGEGYFWHCYSCEEDDFDICSGCYMSGHGCVDKTHTMTLHSLVGARGTRSKKPERSLLSMTRRLLS